MATSYRCENTEYRIVTVDPSSNCDNRLWTWPLSRRHKYVVVIATQTDMFVRRQKLVAVAGSWRELQVMEGWKKILLEPVDRMIQLKTVVTQTQRLMNRWLHWCLRSETSSASMLWKEKTLKVRKSHTNNVNTGDILSLGGLLGGWMRVLKGVNYHLISGVRSEGRHRYSQSVQDRRCASQTEQWNKVNMFAFASYCWRLRS